MAAQFEIFYFYNHILVELNTEILRSHHYKYINYRDYIICIQY